MQYSLLKKQNGVANEIVGGVMNVNMVEFR